MKTKKIVSLLLAVLMACSVFAGLSVVSADETATHTYTVVGDASFLAASWAPNTPADDMALQEDGTYKKTYEGVAKSDLYTIKVAEDHDWGNSFGIDPAAEGANIEFSVPEDNSTVDVILTLTGTREKTLDDGSVVTQTAGYVTVLVNGAKAPDKVVPDVEEHYVAGEAALCNGVEWTAADEKNKMTLVDGNYEITFENVDPKADGTPYEFKVTTNGAWEPAYGYAGEIAAGGANAQLLVTEKGSTVKIVLTAEKKVKVYINGEDKTPAIDDDSKPTETVINGETSAVTSLGGYYAPATGTETKRFFFEMPEEWKTFKNAMPVAYWWDGTDKPADWQHSYILRPTFVKGKSGDIYYIDIPADVPTVIFGNGIDGGEKPAEGQEPSPNWGKNYQTVNIGCEFYSKGESETYPDGNTTFDNMVYVVDPSNVSVNELSGATTYGGEWYYLHADGTYDTKDNKDEPKLEIKGIQVSLNTNNVEVVAGKTVKLVATVANADPSVDAPVVTWVSSNTSVATVDADGVIKGVKAGTASITVTATQGEDTFSATATVTVKPAVVKVSKITLNKTSVSVYNGKTVKLTATVAPSNATSKAITWSTTNKRVATVTSGGVVKGVKPGTAYVRATAKDGSKKYGQCKVTVKAQKATKIKLSKKSITLKLKKKSKSAKVTATLSPKNVYNKAIKVTVNKKKIVKISAKTIKSKKSVKITAKKRGQAKVKFTAKDGSKKSATCKVKVKK